MTPAKTANQLRAIAAMVEQSPSRTRVSSALRRVAERVAVDLPEEGPRTKVADLMVLIGQAREAGYKVIVGLFDDASENVYQILAISKNPEVWEPYRAPMNLATSGSIALWWWFDEELTASNMAGEMIYEEWDPDDLEEGEEAPEVNEEKWREADEEELESGFETLSPEEREAILTRLREAISGSVKDRWADAPRSDQ